MLDSGITIPAYLTGSNASKAGRVRFNPSKNFLGDGVLFVKYLKLNRCQWLESEINQETLDFYTLDRYNMS